MANNGYPLVNPPEMFTNGAGYGPVKMNPRKARLWHYIKTVRGIGLGDFSTDSCVEGVYPELVAARAALDPMILDPKAPPVEMIKDLIGDLECIMKRRPSARVGARR